MCWRNCPGDKTPGFDGDEDAADRASDGLRDELVDLQERLFAEGRHKVLVVLQAMDTGGKDGTIRKVFSGVNPQGVIVARFTAPTPLELAHDYLWRVHQKVPAKGQIVVFNRSHYEDVLVARVNQLVPKKVWQKRYEHLRNFERMLADEGTTILKFYLHIDREEQRQRLQARLDEPDKNWKFDEHDLEQRKHWDQYMEAFRDAIVQTAPQVRALVRHTGQPQVVSGLRDPDHHRVRAEEARSAVSQGRFRSGDDQSRLGFIKPPRSAHEIIVVCNATASAGLPSVAWLSASRPVQSAWRCCPGVAAAQSKLKVAAIYTVPVEQQWVSRIHLALNAAVARGDIEYKFSENVANTDYERVMREYAEQGNGLIVGEAFAVESAARKVAKDYPKTAFLLGSSGKPAAPNFAVFDNYIQEPAYLTGMIAGAMSKTGKIGMVGGYPIPEVNRLMNAFMDGARETNPKVQFMVSFINSWFDPPKAKEASFAMLDKGADVLYAERFGVSDAARERKALAIGNVINTQSTYPETVVASALWNMAPTIDRAIEAVKAGKFVQEDYGQYSMMKFKGSELAPLGTFEGKVPKEVMDKVAARQKAILDGSFVVKVNDSQPAASN